MLKKINPVLAVILFILISCLLIFSFWRPNFIEKMIWKGSMKSIESLKENI